MTLQTFTLSSLAFLLHRIIETETPVCSPLDKMPTEEVPSRSKTILDDPEHGSVSLGLLGVPGEQTNEMILKILTQTSK